MAINRNDQNWWMLKLSVGAIQKELDKPLGESNELAMSRHLEGIRKYTDNLILARKRYIEDTRKSLGIPDLHEEEYELFRGMKF